MLSEWLFSWRRFNQYDKSSIWVRISLFGYQSTTVKFELPASSLGTVTNLVLPRSIVTVKPTCRFYLHIRVGQFDRKYPVVYWQLTSLHLYIGHFRDPYVKVLRWDRILIAYIYYAYLILNWRDTNKRCFDSNLKEYRVFCSLWKTDGNRLRKPDWLIKISRREPNYKYMFVLFFSVSSVRYWITPGCEATVSEFW